MTYILPVIIFMAIGAAAGGLLVLATKFLAVKEDETVAKIAEVLPNANCGACGFAGCADYAKAVAAGTAPSNKCKPGGADVAAKVAAIMGSRDRQGGCVCSLQWLSGRRGGQIRFHRHAVLSRC